MQRYCLTLDLKDDPVLIAQYEEHHKAVWPEILGSIKESGISNMEIYRYETRLFMIMEVEEGFTFENKQLLDAGNEKVQEWEELMWKYQQPIVGASANVKWVVMNKIFKLS